jgi:hypothetical protein
VLRGIARRPPGQPGIGEEEIGREDGKRERQAKGCRYGIGDDGVTPIIRPPVVEDGLRQDTIPRGAAPRRSGEVRPRRLSAPAPHRQADQIASAPSSQKAEDRISATRIPLAG